MTVALVAAVGLALLGGLSTLGWEPLRLYEVPLVAAADEPRDRSELVELIEEAFPEAVVNIRSGTLQVSGSEEELELRRLLSVVGSSGYETSNFSLGWDLSIEGIARSLSTRTAPLLWFLIPLPLILGIAGGLLRRRLPTDGDTSRRPWLSSTLIGVGVGLGAVVLLGALSWLASSLGYPVVEQPWVLALLEGGRISSIALFCSAVFLAPIGEELFYRGWLFPYLAPWGKLPATVVSAALFALVHLHPPAFAAYFTLGVVLAAVYDRTDSLVVPIVAHATNNLIALALLMT